MPERFVILTNGRSGSTMLVDLIGSHPDIYCEAEIFNEIRWKRSHRPLLWLVRAWPFPYLDWRARKCTKAVYGFKLKAGGQIYHMEQKVHRLFQRGWRLVYLYRRDILQQTISWNVARATRRWHTTLEAGYMQQQVHLDVDLFLRDMHTALKDKQELAEMMRQLPNLTLVYEDDLEQQDHLQATSARLCDYLKVRQAPLSSKIIRTWDRPYSEVISNYAELMKAVENSPLLKMPK